MDLRIRLLLGLLSGSVALAAFCLGAEQRSDGQHLSQFATRDTWPVAGAALVFAGAVWWWVERAWRRQCLRVQAAERAALARELHDEFGQNLTVMVTAAGYMERHAGTASAQALGECARDVRVAAMHMARQLREQLGRLRQQPHSGEALRDELEALIESHWLRAAGLAVEVAWPKRLPALSADARLALYRTVQEALSNVVRHAKASRVVLKADRDGAGLRLCVEDDGCGGVQAALTSRHSGIQGMRERAAMAGGHLVLGPSVLGGLRVTLWLPTNEKMDNNRQGDKNHGERVAAG